MKKRGLCLICGELTEIYLKTCLCEHCTCGMGDYAMDRAHEGESEGE